MSSSSTGRAVAVPTRFNLVGDPRARRSQLGTRQAHNLEVAGSNPAPATKRYAKFCNIYFIQLVEWPLLHWSL